MSANTKWREEFIARLSRDRDALPLDTLRRLMRHAATLQRLAEAQCNGDYPYNGDRDRPDREQPNARAQWDRWHVTCPRCEQLCVKSMMKRVAYMSEGKGGRTYYRQECPDCRTQALVTKLLQDTPWRPVFQGDPRGCVLKIARRLMSTERCDQCYSRDTYNEIQNDIPGRRCLSCQHWTGGPTAGEDIANGRAESRGDVIGVPA